MTAPARSGGGRRLLAIVLGGLAGTALAWGAGVFSPRQSYEAVLGWMLAAGILGAAVGLLVRRRR